MTIRNKLIIEDSTLWSNFEMCTRDFNRVDVDALISKSKYAFKVKHLDVDYIEPFMLYIIFVQLLEFEHEYKPFEKVLYEIPFQYKEHYCMFSMEKFGLKLVIDTEDKTILEGIFKKLKSASKITKKLLKPTITQSIDNGDFTIENNSEILRQRYQYFKGRIELVLSDFEDEKQIEPKWLMGRYNRKIRLEKEVIFNTQAMLDAYFSFQEHILILLLPFTNLNFKNERITVLLNSNWTEKFNEVFQPTSKPKVMRHFLALKEIKELRNKYAHGGFNKGEAALLAHVEGVGALPVELPSYKERGFSFLLINDIDYDKICEIIDSFESYLAKSEWSRALKILECGIDMRFDKNFISEINNAISSEEMLGYFIYKETESNDREVNMDW